MAKDNIVRTTGQLGPILQRIRRAQGLSQETVGTRLGLSQERISAIEKYPEKVSLDQLLSMLMVLDAEIVIVQRKPDKTKPGVAESPTLERGGW